MPDPGWPQDRKHRVTETDEKPNGKMRQDLQAAAEVARQGQLLKNAMKRLGRPAEIILSEHLDEGQLYIVDTSQGTALYDGEKDGKILIVHRGMEEDARTMKEALDKVLEEVMEEGA